VEHSLLLFLMCKKSLKGGG